MKGKQDNLVFFNVVVDNRMDNGIDLCSALGFKLAGFLMNLHISELFIAKTGWPRFALMVLLLFTFLKMKTQKSIIQKSVIWRSRMTLKKT